MIYLSTLSFSRSRDHRDLHSFPTRRSSDLRLAIEALLASRAAATSASWEPERTAAMVATSPAFSRAKENQSFCSSVNFFSDRKSTRLNSSHGYISYAVFCLKKKKKKQKY